LQTADRLGLPLLLASFDMAFVKLSRHVIGQVLQAQQDNSRTLAQLLQTSVQALREAVDLSGQLTLLARQLHLDLALTDNVSGALLAACQTWMQDVGTGEAACVERIDIGGRSRAQLLLRPRAHASLAEPELVRALVDLLRLELERQVRERDHTREEGAQLLRNLLADDTEVSSRHPLLACRGWAGDLLGLAITTGPSSPWALAELHQAPGVSAYAPLFLQEGDVLLALLPEVAPTVVPVAAADGIDGVGVLDVLQAHLGAHGHIGVSLPVTQTSIGLDECLRQARLALALAQETRLPCYCYGTRNAAACAPLTTPQTLAEARAVVARHLGPLIDYDQTHGTVLLHTVQRFLDNDRLFKATAFDLGIHRQTLVYRLKLVEQLTGLKPASTEGTARLWLALQAGRAAGLLEGSVD